MIRVWGRKTSSNVMKVLHVLDELGLNYERVDVGGAFGGTATPAYRAMQPLGLVPALEEDDFSLFESNAIMRYLCRAHGADTMLYPRDPRAAGVVDAWMDFQQTALNGPVGVFFIGLVRTPVEKRDNAAIAAAIVQAQALYGLVDAELARQDWIAGDDFTIADVAYGPQVHRWFVLDLPGRVELPHLRRWYERMKGRPAYVAHCTAPPV